MRKNLLQSLALTAIAVMLPTALSAQTIVMEENFDKFSAGAVDLADDTQIGNDSDKPFATGKLDAYTVLPGWMGYGVYQAAGTCVVKGADVYTKSQVTLTTPEISFSGNTKITVRARIYPGSTATATTTSMSMTMLQGFKHEDKNVDLSKDWQEFELEGPFTGKWQLELSVGDKNSPLDEIPSMQIDYVKAVDLGGKVDIAAPMAYEATSVKATSFTANWQTVSAAQSYLLYVEGTKDGKTTMVVDGLEVPPASWGEPYKKVNDLDPESFYTYYVKAKAGDNVSEASNKVDVVYMPVVEPTAATDITSDGFTANWKATQKANSHYKVNIYRIDPSGRELLKSTTSTTNSCAVTGLKEYGAAWYAYDVIPIAQFNGKEYETVASRRQVVTMNDAERKTETVIEEDFSRLTNGSEDEIYYKDYDPQEVGNEGPYVNLWDSQGGIIPDKYTQTPGWTGAGVAEAGGVAACSYMPYPESYYGGRITTPKLPLGGLVTLKFRARAIQNYKPASAENPQYIPLYLSTNGDSRYDIVKFSDGLEILVAEYDDYDGGTYREESMRIELSDNEWHEYSLTLLNYYQGDAKFQIGTASEDYAAFFIDDIKIESALTSLPVPQTDKATDFTKDGFTANWQAVEKADDYLLSVYRRKAGKDEYAYTDIPVEGLSYVVTGLDPESDYMYTVKAHSGAVVSGSSKPVSAMGISQPVLLKATDLNENGFTANWERTPKASRYALKVFAGNVAEGEPVISQVIESGTTTSFAITGLNITRNKDFCYQLTAFYDTSSETYESVPSEPMAVDMSQVGISMTETATDVRIEKTGDAIRVTLSEPLNVLVARADGTIVKSSLLSEGETLINVAPGTIYIIKVADKTVKLTF